MVTHTKAQSTSYFPRLPIWICPSRSQSKCELIGQVAYTKARLKSVLPTEKKKKKESQVYKSCSEWWKNVILNFFAPRCHRRPSYQRWWLLRERPSNPGGGARCVDFPIQMMGGLFVCFSVCLHFLFVFLFVGKLATKFLLSAYLSVCLLSNKKVNSLKQEQRAMQWTRV